MLVDAPHLCASDFLSAVADAEEANGLTTNAAEFRRRAFEVRELERRVESLERATRAPAVPVAELRQMIARVEGRAVV